MQISFSPKEISTYNKQTLTSTAESCKERILAFQFQLMFLSRQIPFLYSLNKKK